MIEGEIGSVNISEFAMAINDLKSLTAEKISQIAGVDMNTIAACEVDFLIEDKVHRSVNLLWSVIQLVQDGSLTVR